MRQFNLEEYLKNPTQKVVTRDGRDATIIYTNKRDIGGFSIVALVHEGNFDDCVTYLPDGACLPSGHSGSDLFFAPEKHEGWVNIYKTTLGTQLGEIYNLKEDAEAMAIKCKTSYITTIKIEWEE